LSHRLRRDLSAFHQEERGASGSVDNVMIIFVAAIILIGLITMFNTSVWETVKSRISDLMGKSIAG
jgi:nitrate reductase gamma subunit